LLFGHAEIGKFGPFSKSRAIGLFDFVWIAFVCSLAADFHLRQECLNNPSVAPPVRRASARHSCEKQKPNHRHVAVLSKSLAGVCSQ
jgi:hypothetical protein